MGAPLFTEAQLEQMRAIGLRLDRGGTFWQEGAPVTHARLRQALLRWLDVRDDGRDIVRLDAKRYAYVDIEDAHLRARSLRWEGDRAWILWDDDAEGADPDELAYATLRRAPDAAAGDNALYATARGRLRGRIAGPAYLALAERISPAAAGDGGSGFELDAAGRRWPIA